MKPMKIFRIISIAFILSLLVVAIPAAPALAAKDIILYPLQGKISDNITVTGTGFSTSTTDKYVDIYFSSDPPLTGTYSIDNQITHYTVLYAGAVIDETGTFTKTVTVPGTIGTSAVAADTPYYIYVTSEYFQPAVGTVNPSKTIATSDTFFVTASPTLDPLSPTEGTVGTGVTISGANFSANTTIVIKYDGTEIPKTEDTKTRPSGLFSSKITIPESTAGAHTITVTIASTTVTAQFTVKPSITFTPISGAAGSNVTISGKGFGQQKEVDISFGNAGVKTIRTDSLGSFAQTIFKVPLNVGAGTYFIEANDGQNTDKKNFTVPTPTATPTTTPTPTPTATPTPTPTPSSNTTLSISPESGSVGTLLAVIGFGFKPNGTITVKYDDKVVATATANADGIFSYLLNVPPSIHGDHTITVSDGTNTNQKKFTVESVPPAIAQLLLPETGAKVKAPIVFDWEEVTDNSSPVPYSLQIATDRNFTATSIVLEKTALTKSEYTLTEADELKLPGKETPYYWRVRAIDAAQNEGQWTGAREFYVTLPFKFTGWPLYAALGFGAVLVFLFGFWVGRRTAYFY